MAKTKEIKKVTAKVVEQYVEPDYEALFKCPYCKADNHFYLDYEEDYIDTHKCFKCKKTFKVKIPKYL